MYILWGWQVVGELEGTDSSLLIQTMKEVEKTTVPSCWLHNLLAQFGVISSRVVVPIFQQHLAPVKDGYALFFVS